MIRTQMDWKQSHHIIDDYEECSFSVHNFLLNGREGMSTMSPSSSEMVEPEGKKPKTGTSAPTDTASSTSWRQKCISTFQLEAIPEAWSDKVPVFSEAAWERYYRVRMEKNNISLATSDGEEGKEEDDALGSVQFEEFSSVYQENNESSWDVECMNHLKSEMEEKIERLEVQTKLKCPWKWTPGIEEAFEWHDHNDLRRGVYLAYVWSPFAIPHAIALEHYYYHRPHWSTMEFWTTWKYALIDFEDNQSTKQLKTEDFKFLCSNGYEDERLRADVIDTDNLTMTTVNRMRAFLYGSRIKACKEQTCCDLTFLELLFGSMGTCDFGEDAIGSWLGYSWSPSNEQRAHFMKNGVPASDEESGPPGDKYEYGEVSWLEYRIKEITKTLGAFSQHYSPPSIEDAPGYDPRIHRDEDDGPRQDLGFDEEHQNLYEGLRAELDPFNRRLLDVTLGFVHMQYGTPPRQER